QTNLVAGIASLVGTGDSVKNNTIDHVSTVEGDGIYCGGVGEIVNVTIGGTFSGNVITNCGQHGIHFDLTPNKFNLVIEGNVIDTVGGVGMYCGQLIQCVIKGNIVT